MMLKCLLSPVFQRYLFLGRVSVIDTDGRRLSVFTVSADCGLSRRTISCKAYGCTWQTSGWGQAWTFAPVLPPRWPLGRPEKRAPPWANKRPGVPPFRALWRGAQTHGGLQQASDWTRTHLTAAYSLILIGTLTQTLNIMSHLNSTIICLLN